MRNYGLCLWSFGDIPFEKKCELAKSIGVDGVEVQGDITQDPEYILNTLKKYDLEILSVTPDNVDISSDTQDIRKSAVKYFLELLEWAKKIDITRICLHGDVGKITGCGNTDKDWKFLVESSKEVIKKAEELNIQVVFEVLNRYENYQILTGDEALVLINDVGSDSLYVLLDAYHMNIEEAQPSETLKNVGKKLGLYHVADSNRQAIGNGHSDIKKQIQTLHEINYTGPIIMEMVAEGPNPFSAVKGDNYLEVLCNYYRKSLVKLKKWDEE